MNTEYIGIIFMYLATVVLAIPLGKYIAKVFQGEKTWLDFMAPLERLIFKFSGIDPHKEMNWKQHLKAILTVNLVWLFYTFFCLLFQGHLPLNPDGNPSQTPDLAFNTALSFVTNTNLQDYSGEIRSNLLYTVICVNVSAFCERSDRYCSYDGCFQSHEG